jgi:hypothetical protein
MGELNGAIATLACSLFAGAALYIAILPTNKKLLEAGRDNSSQETRQLLETWGRLHSVRSVASLAATLLFLSALVEP